MLKNETTIEYRVSYGGDGPCGEKSVGVTYLPSAVAIASELKTQGEPEVKIWTRQVHVTEWAEVT